MRLKMDQPKVNGTTTYKHTIIEQHTTLDIDACLNKVGCVWMNYVYSAKDIKDKGLSITHLEMLNILVALKVWGQKWTGQQVTIKTDNMAVVKICNTDYTRDMKLASYIRNIWLVTSMYDIELIITHIAGRLNTAADLLSRWSDDQDCQELLKSLIEHPKWCHVERE